MAKKQPEKQPERSKPPIKVKKPKGTRLHVTPDEWEAILKGAGSIGRHRHRDQTMILMGFLHGFRSEELVKLLWDQIDLERRTLSVVRCKRGVDSTHDLRQDEIKALRKLAKEQGSGQRGYVFTSERGDPMTTSTYGKFLARAGKKAGIPFRVGTHMLRHGCGYWLGNKGKDTRGLQVYLGHNNIAMTVKYTDLAKGRFKGWTED